MSAEPLKQGNLFTGEWEPKRSRASHPMQTSMFSINETFQFGAKAHPHFAEAGAPTLVLTREDVRTLEEIERDLMREAEAMNHTTFVETPGMFDCKRTALIVDGSSIKDIAENGKQPEQSEPDNEVEQSPHHPTGEKITKLSCYLELVALAHEQAVTLWVDDAYRGLYHSQMPQAILTAHGAGLAASEISTALQIGEFQGRRERDAAPPRSEGIPSTLSQLAPSVTGARLPNEGFRARYRREHVPVRSR